jgi:hypothetical protein
LNESNENIYPGDKVMLDVNVNYARKVTREKGIPREKVRFTVKRALTSDEMLDEALTTSLAAATPTNTQKNDVTAARTAEAKAQADLTAAEALSPTTPGTKLKVSKAKGKLKAAKKLLADKIAVTQVTGGRAGIVALLNKLRILNDRVIGKAYSFARPGDRLEIGLQPRSEY